MADVHTKKQRSKNMSAIRSKGNKNTELKTIALFKKYGIAGWRRHYDKLPGKPDFIFYDKKTAVFIDGCFWHGCKKCFVQPKSNRRYWKLKIEKNHKRDKDVVKSLSSKGWKVVRIWEHKLHNLTKLPHKLINILKK